MPSSLAKMDWRSGTISGSVLVSWLHRRITRITAPPPPRKRSIRCCHQVNGNRTMVRGIRPELARSSTIHPTLSMACAQNRCRCSRFGICGRDDWDTDIAHGAQCSPGKHLDRSFAVVRRRRYQGHIYGGRFIWLVRRKQLKDIPIYQPLLGSLSI